MRVRMALAAAISPLLHVLAAGVLFAIPVLSNANSHPAASRATSRAASASTSLVMYDPPLPPPPEPEKKLAEQPKEMTAEEDEPLKLGIEHSNAKDSKVWLGFEDPSPQQAPKSVVEQAALARELLPAAAPQPAQAAMTPAGQAESAPATLSPKPTAPPGQEAPREAANPDPKAKPAEKPPVEHESDDPGRGKDTNRAEPVPVKAVVDPATPADAAGAAAPGKGKDTSDKAEPAPAPVPVPPKGVPEEVVGPPAPPDQPSPDASQAAPAKPGAGADSTPPTPVQPAAPPGPEPIRNAEKSEKESDATSLTEPVEIRPGRPAAAQGLDITTKRPVFTTYTQLTAWPSNPVLKLTFNRLGKVSKVEWVKKSGFEAVDEPVLNAVWAWTAKGKAITDLAAKGPEAGVTISVRIILR